MVVAAVEGAVVAEDKVARGCSVVECASLVSVEHKAEVEPAAVESVA